STSLINSIRGPDLYRSYCAACHGTDGKGDGPMAKWLKTAPADLTGIAARNGGTYPLPRVRGVISGETEIATGHGLRQMPVWGPIFSQVASDRDFGKVRVDNLARYIGQLQKK